MTVTRIKTSQFAQLVKDYERTRCLKIAAELNGIPATTARYNLILYAGFKPRNTRRKITEQDIEQFKELRQAGLTPYQIEKRTGRSRKTVVKYWHGLTNIG